MENLLLISHGSYARATLESCEMIVGPLANVRAIEFKQTMNQDDLLAEIAKTAAEFSTMPTILVDFKGGTPSNTALRFQKAHPEVKIYTGLSFSVLLGLATGLSFAEAFKESAETSGLLGDKPAAPKQKENSQKENTPAAGALNIRIDERLIHGQVATMWTNRLQLTRLMVVDDQIVKSSIQKTALKTACPANVHLSILTAKGAAKRINEGKYRQQRVLLLVKNPGVLRQLLDYGVNLPAINVGNMSTKDDSKQVAKSVAVTKQDISDFEYLAQHGLKLYHQMVPTEPAEDFMPMLQK